MRTRQTQLRGAFGASEVRLTPQSARRLDFDITNCPHCGGHHASVAAKIVEDRVTLECPSLRRPLVLTAKLFLHKL